MKNIIFVNSIDFQAARECLECLNIHFFEHSHQWEILLTDQNLDYMESYRKISESKLIEIYNSIGCLADYKKLSENQLKNLFWFFAYTD